MDDYLAKPFHAQVLLARVAKLLGVIHQDLHQPLVILPNEKRVLLNGTQLDLTSREYDVLFYLYQNQGLPLTREQILLSVWGLDNENDERTVDSFIRMLREKIGKEFIQTVYGTGYRFELAKNSLTRVFIQRVAIIFALILLVLTLFYRWGFPTYYYWKMEQPVKEAQN